MHDPIFYDSPELFKPERYLSHEFGLKAGTDAPYWRHTYTFGAGRRICPGLQFADAELAVVIPKLLHAFTFSPLPGKKLDTSWAAYVQRGTLAAPLPFEVDIQPRTPRLAEAVKAAYEAELPLLERYDPEV